MTTSYGLYYGLHYDLHYSLHYACTTISTTVSTTPAPLTTPALRPTAATPLRPLLLPRCFHYTRSSYYACTTPALLRGAVIVEKL
jgi:hypothetical protein